MDRPQSALVVHIVNYIITHAPLSMQIGTSVPRYALYDKGSFGQGVSSRSEGSGKDVTVSIIPTTASTKDTSHGCDTLLSGCQNGFCGVLYITYVATLHTTRKMDSILFEF